MPGPSLEEGPARQADRSRFRQSIRGAVAILAIHADGVFIFHTAKRHGEDARDRGAPRDLATTRTPVDDLRRAPTETVRVATRARASSNRRLGDVLRALRCAIVYGPRRDVLKKSRRLSHRDCGLGARDDDLAFASRFPARTSISRLSCVGDWLPFVFGA